MALKAATPRLREENAVPDSTLTLGWSDGSGPYCDVTLSLRGRPVQWNETTGELTIGLPLAHDKEIDSALFDIAVRALPSLDESDLERIAEKLSFVLHRESVRLALLTLVKEN